MFNPVVPYRYLLPTLYLFMADIVNPDLFVCSCRTWICLDITRFMRSSDSHPAGPNVRLAKENGKSVPHFCVREVSTQYVQQIVAAVTAPPLVGRVVWSHRLCLLLLLPLLLLLKSAIIVIVRLLKLVLYLF